MGDLCLDVDSSSSHSPHESTSPSSSFYQSSSSPPPPTSSSSSSTPNKLKLKLKLVVSDLSYTIDPKGSQPLWHGLMPKPKPINVLKSVSFAAHSSQVLAVVGPSGTGKSTLLRVVSGRVAGSEFDPKSVSLNGCPAAGPEQMRNVCGFVTQDDNLLPLLTVKETLMFSAHFRLKGWSRRRKEERICALMQELGLDHIADSYVGGDEERRGISGGERKRVSIGVDVIHNPPVLLLDEPTSGLDSTSALQVVELLSSMARTRQQILILTIHQPSYRILHHISTFLLLSRGRVAYCGSLVSLEDTIQAGLCYRIPVQLNALEFAMEITQQLEDHNAKLNQAALLLRRRCRSTPTIHDLVRCDVDFAAAAAAADKYCCMLDEIVSLSGRIWKIIYRTKELFLARTMQAVVGSLGLGSVFLHVKKDQDGVAERLGFFAFGLSFLLSSTVEALPIFLQERRVLMRESSRRMYRLSSYMLANTAVFAPFLLVVALLFAGPVYWLVGLNPSLGAFLFFALVVWLIVMMAGSLVLFLSAISPDFILGNSLISMFLGVFFLFSGYFIPKESIPKYWIFMYYLSLYRYPLDSLLINEYWSLRDECFSWQQEDGNAVCSLTGGDVLRNRGLDTDTRVINVGIMCGFFLVYRFLCWIVLVRKASKTTL